MRTALNNTTANRPKGSIEDRGCDWQIGANDQALTAAAYATVLLRDVNGAAVRLDDVANVVASVQDMRNQ